jgi:hypothetical protein
LLEIHFGLCIQAHIHLGHHLQAVVRAIEFDARNPIAKGIHVFRRHRRLRRNVDAV